HGAISANFDDERIRVRCPAVLDITFSEGEQVSRKRWTVDVHVAPACLGPASATAYDSAEFDCWLQALAWPEAGGNSLKGGCRSYLDRSRADLTCSAGGRHPTPGDETF